jgi:D-beta-D-heptose 7-phosphate kinase/D-beta-D-heptose 1-phosphate adenosyltransferase
MEVRLSESVQELPVDVVRSLLARMVGRRIAVIGDAMLDTYVFGRVGRLSPEAPVPIVAVEREESWPGGAANVAKCLVTLGAKARLCAVIGGDEHGRTLLGELRALGVDTRDVAIDAARPTTVKRRVLAQRQQLIRMDHESTAPLAKTLEQRLLKKVRSAVRWADAVILSDYHKGFLTPALCHAVLKEAGKRPVIVDPKAYGWERFRGATVFKPNRRDAAAVLGRDLADDHEALTGARETLRRVGAAHVLLTRGEKGMLLVSRDGPARRTPRVLPALWREVYDVTGAGDVVGATLALALAAGAEIDEAVRLANIAAGVKVGKLGAASVAPQEMLDLLGHGALECERKVMTRRQAAAFATRLRSQGRRVVFTNGCFDILHYGHVSYLERSRRLGDALIVGLNSDASVRRLKGAGRPVQNQHDRARILAAQGGVDAVVIFDEDTPRKLVEAIRPQVLCKGADYKRKQNVVGWDLVERWGGRVVLVELIEGRSTTGLIRRTRN